ncbi:unnamed protein product [Enterobius vermicularis]|uniref:RING-type domain-containing protein n=1 Tax=Enterobius vermicularis TaxID=51028 RepID=A0A0N4UV89_ENTVE|nr:unnamed protein product [Enterobius vermicularis]
MSDWLHCNICVRLPTSSENVPFFLTSCGHIICQQCLEKSGVSSCQVCQKAMHVLEINRLLRPEHQMYFRNPKELLETYVKNINSVLDFQAHHRSRLMKARQDHVIFRKALAEKADLAEEVKKLRQHTQKLEDL